MACFLFFAMVVALIGIDTVWIDMDEEVEKEEKESLRIDDIDGWYE